MRSSWAIGLVALVAIAAGSAGAAEGKGSQQAAAANPSAEATKHLAVIHAALETAEINADMLGEITKSQDTYDRAHGGVFAKNIRDALTQAQAHLAHLEPLATSDAQKKQFGDLRDRAAKAETMAKGLDASLGNPTELNKAAAELEKELDGSERPMEQLARDMNVKADVG
jgi:hypothetical protein